MARFVSMWIFACITVLGPAAWAEGARLPSTAVALDSPEGERLLVESTSRRDYFGLAETFVTQKAQSLCGTASVAMVLNALPIPAPAVAEWAPYRSFTQENLWNARAEALGVARGGLTMEQLHLLVEAHPATAKMTYASDISLAAFRTTIADDFADPSGYVIVNFLRSALGEEPNGPIEAQLAGHWSPIAAFHAGDDRVLMLDVARYKYPAAWVAVAALYDAMKTMDVDSGKTRGFLQVRAAPGVAEKAPIPPHSTLLRFASGVAALVFALGALAGSLFTRWRLRRVKARAR